MATISLFEALGDKSWDSRSWDTGNPEFDASPDEVGKQRDPSAASAAASASASTEAQVENELDINLDDEASHWKRIVTAELWDSEDTQTYDYSSSFAPTVPVSDFDYPADPWMTMPPLLKQHISQLELQQLDLPHFEPLMDLQQLEMHQLELHQLEQQQKQQRKLQQDKQLHQQQQQQQQQQPQQQRPDAEGITTQVDHRSTQNEAQAANAAKRKKGAKPRSRRSYQSLIDRAMEEKKKKTELAEMKHDAASQMLALNMEIEHIQAMRTKIMQERNGLIEKEKRRNGIQFAQFEGNYDAILFQERQRIEMEELRLLEMQRSAVCKEREILEREEQRLLQMHRSQKQLQGQFAGHTVIQPEAWAFNKHNRKSLSKEQQQLQTEEQRLFQMQNSNVLQNRQNGSHPCEQSTSSGQHVGETVCRSCQNKVGSKFKFCLFCGTRLR
eukprot:TRINITY_DN589_c1_g1_i1.p1 TRINITY_DN589_c1_g1~~TRINITY_DN589_c1_g1_i1.p1  ORF type:complete len:442 (-),score=108.83 TRINITY_DN589_c1_g1_i1:173-1498(-)